MSPLPARSVHQSLDSIVANVAAKAELPERSRSQSTEKAVGEANLNRRRLGHELPCGQVFMNSNTSSVRRSGSGPSGTCRRVDQTSQLAPPLGSKVRSRAGRRPAKFPDLDLQMRGDDRKVPLCCSAQNADNRIGLSGTAGRRRKPPVTQIDVDKADDYFDFSDPPSTLYRVALRWLQ